MIHEAATAETISTRTNEIALARNDAVVKTGVIAAMGVGLAPVPAFDVLAVVGVNMTMIRKLAEINGADFDAVLARSIVITLAGGAAPVLATAGMASMLKLFPGIGSLAGGASVSLLSGAVTYAIGTTFATHFQGGGTLLDFDLAQAKAAFAPLTERGRAFARALYVELAGGAAKKKPVM